MLATLLALTALAASEPDLARVLDRPPWPTAADETPFPDSVSFRPCDRLIAKLARHTQGRIDAPRHALSQRWGWIARARLVFPGEPTSAMLATCWSPAGVTFSIVLEPEHMFGPVP